MGRGNWSRHEFVVAGLSVAALLPYEERALAAMAAHAPCALTPEQEEGPYYIADELVRPDITEGRGGVPLSLRLQVVDVRTGEPIEGAAVDVWHCDAMGVYSGYAAASAGPPPGGGPPPDGAAPNAAAGGPPKVQPAARERFLRGIQLTDGRGLVRFNTIYPGFYPGRVNHIHVKTHLAGQLAGRSYRGGHVAHTGQVFFPEEISRTVAVRKPYVEHRIERTTLEQDGVFNAQAGNASIAMLTPNGAQAADGYIATLTFGVDPTATPAPAARRPPGQA